MTVGTNYELRCSGDILGAIVELPEELRHWAYAPCSRTRGELPGWVKICRFEPHKDNEACRKIIQAYAKRMEHILGMQADRIASKYKVVPFDQIDSRVKNFIKYLQKVRSGMKEVRKGIGTKDFNFGVVAFKMETTCRVGMDSDMDEDLRELLLSV